MCLKCIRTDSECESSRFHNWKIAWVMTPCRLVYVTMFSEEHACSIFKVSRKMGLYIPPKYWYPVTKLHGFITQSYKSCWIKFKIDHSSCLLYVSVKITLLGEWLFLTLKRLTCSLTATWRKHRQCYFCVVLKHDAKKWGECTWDAGIFLVQKGIMIWVLLKNNQKGYWRSMQHFFVLRHCRRETLGLFLKGREKFQTVPSDCALAEYRVVWSNNYAVDFSPKLWISIILI